MAVTLEDMMHLTLRDRHGAATMPFLSGPNLPADSDHYYRRIEEYARRIRSTPDVHQIVSILDEALSDTRALHGSNGDSATEQRLRQAEQEIETLKAELERTAALTNTDPLTGLLNRRGLDLSFNAEASRSDRHGTPLCAALIDIDDFKRINDTHGHPTGDAALTHICAVMRASLRPNDIMARVGGEEFLLLLPDSNEQAAFTALNRLLKAVSSHPVIFGKERLAITFTASVALRGFGEILPRLYARMDESLIAAKAAGKNRVMFCKV